MKKIASQFATVSCLVFGVAMAYAEPAACHDPAPGKMHGQMGGAMFKEMDANGNGAVSSSEFKAFHARRFKEMDANKDGKITFDEMNGGRGRAMGNGATTHLDERFNAADADHDGGLDTGEAQAMPMLSLYFGEVDANKDGKVTRQEYFDAMPLLHRAKKEKAESL